MAKIIKTAAEMRAWAIKEKRGLIPAEKIVATDVIKTKIAAAGIAIKTAAETAAGIKAGTAVSGAEDGRQMRLINAKKGCRTK